VSGTPAYEGLVNNESFAVTGSIAWAFADKNAGTGKTLARTGSFSAPSENYSIASQPLLTASINAKELTVTGAIVTTKVYDGSSAATITGATLVNAVSTDNVTVSGGGAFNNANAGASKPVTASLILGGADAANYTLVQPALTGTISKADQTITFGPIAGKNTGDAPFQLSATASSGLPVAYTSSNPSVASVGGNTITVLSPGTTTITAAQAGDGNYNAATSVDQPLVVTDLPVLLAGWDFQTTTNGGTAATSTNAPLVYTANFGSGSLHLDGSHGSSTWYAAPTTGSSNQVGAFSGTLTNLGTGFSSNTTSPAALALSAGTSNSANGKSLVFKFGMDGRKDLNVSYATRGTSSGFNTHTWSCSTNATNWTQISVQTGRTNTNFTAINLPVITNLDGAAQAFFPLTVEGATSASGNNRLDNIQFTASQASIPDTTSPVITVLGDNPLTLPAGSAFTDPGATASDNVDASVTVIASGTVNTAVPGSYTITYSAQDAAGNTASATRTVNVVARAAYLLKTLYGLTGASALLGADADNDGVVNLVEYAFGADPSLSSSAPSSPSASVVAGALRISAVVREDDSQLGFAAKSASNPVSSWTTNNVTELDNVNQSGVPAGFRRRAWQATQQNQPAQFMRLEVSYP